MINDILTLIKIITVLYYENLSEEDHQYVHDETRALLSNIKTNNRGTVTIGSEEGAIEALRYTAEWMLNNNHNEIKYTRENILQRLRINLCGDNSYIEIAEKSFDDSITPDTASKQIEEILSELRYEKRNSKLKQIISEANKAVNFGSEFIDTNAFIHEMMNSL